ncbi:TonB-dependent receptor [Limibacter armeniacum]|uniref:SusC/RagA family TonB-linked outer membrane protein n=1 Tax=Limibacter armeniacum TaxID=466084 RepID=UPI002FE58C52
MRKTLLLLTFVLGLFSMALAQERTVSGVVKDASGEPLPGATVHVKGSTIGSVTNLDGEFKLNVPNDASTLVFSLVGFLSIEQELGTQSLFELVMEEDVKQLNEVVVTGYGELDKKKITGSIATVDAKLIEQVPVATFDQMIQGQSPGLYVNAGSGQPGAAATVRIRGNGSINGGNDPLYIVDGVPIESDAFTTLNANDFASISVLKDASATAQYGSRGGNGVIVITTKKGAIGKTRVNYRYQTGWSKIGDMGVEMMNTQERLAYEEIIKRGPGWTYSSNNPDAPDDAAEKLAALRNTNTDWVDAVTRIGRTETHEVNISGGAKGTRFYVSGNYFAQEGVAEGSDLERITGRFNIDHEYSDKLRFGLSANVGRSTSQYIPSEGLSTANPFVLATIDYMPYDSIQVTNPTTGEKEYKLRGFGRNPVEMVDTYIEKMNELKAIVSTYVEAELFPNVTAKSKIGFDFRNREYEEWADPEGTLSAWGKEGQGFYSATSASKFQYNWVNSVQWAKTIGDHDFDVMAGTEILEKSYNNFDYTGYGINPKLPQTPAGITPGTPDNNLIPDVGGEKWRTALMSYFVFANYTFDKRFSFQGTVRRDGSSKFGDNNQWAIFWSTGLSYNLTEEAFLQSAENINLLKVRASYGTVGNQDDTDLSIEPFQKKSAFGSTVYGSGQGLVPTVIEYPDLSWEQSSKFNAGIDFGFFQNKVRGSLDVYNDITSALFVEQQLSRTSGFDDLDINAGKMRNRGIELQLTTTNISSATGFKWETTLNFGHNDNEILDLGQVDEFLLGTGIVREGLPLGSHYTVGWAGVNPANGQPLYYDKDGNVTTVYSSANEVADWGTSNPPNVGGITNTFSYKGLSLSVFFNFQQGHRLFNNQSYFIENHNVGYNQSAEMLDLWQKEGDITSVQGLGYAREFTSRDIEDASFLRLRNVNLSYTLPSTAMSKLKYFSSIRVYAQAQNLYTWTKFTGFDPEIGNNIAQFQYPTPRTATVGVDISF